MRGEKNNDIMRNEKDSDGKKRERNKGGKICDGKIKATKRGMANAGLESFDNEERDEY